METMTKEEQISFFLKQYSKVIEEKNGIYYYPENIPVVLKEYLDNINNFTKSFPQWHLKSENIAIISEEEKQKILNDLEEEDDDDYTINFY